jgi:hypothetical protein
MHRAQRSLAGRQGEFAGTHLIQTIFSPSIRTEAVLFNRIQTAEGHGPIIQAADVIIVVISREIIRCQ